MKTLTEKEYELGEPVVNLIKDSHLTQAEYDTLFEVNIDILQKVFNRVSNTAEEINDIEEERDELQDDVSALEEKIDFLKQEVNDIEEERDELQKENKTLNIKIKELEERVMFLEHENGK